MKELIPINRQVIDEATQLADEILKDIELSRISLSNAALKASRLARLLNEFEMQSAIQFDVSGVPSSGNVISQSDWKLCEIAGRVYSQYDTKTNTTKSFAHTASISVYENKIEAAKIALGAAGDRDVSISSANPSQHVFTPMTNKHERDMLQLTINNTTARISERSNFIHTYALQKYLQLKFSKITEDVFSRIRIEADKKVSELVPTAIQKFNAIHEYLESENPENWSNAVHSCRRILEAIADVLFPPQESPRIKDVGGKKKEIKLGEGNYKNRLICFVEDQSASERFQEIVGSNLEYLVNRLDSVIQAAQKGTHDEILSKIEADRYVIYTYMIVNDILSLV